MYNKYTKGTGIARIKALGLTSGMTLSQIASAAELTKSHVCQLMRQYELPYAIESTYHKGYWPRRRLRMKKVRVSAKVQRTGIGREKRVVGRLTIDSLSTEHKLASWKDLAGYIIKEVKVLGIDEVELVLADSGIYEVNPKPKPELIKALVEKGELQPRRVMMLEDSGIDAVNPRPGSGSGLKATSSMIINGLPVRGSYLNGEERD